MTTLLIDNYDSFTFNLVQLLMSLGERVQVLKNDDRQGWERVDWTTVDRIVVSPGPGNPAVPADLGLSRDAVLSRRRPLLGVCLGHQALCFLSGSVIGRAPLPVHGQASPIVHAGDDLFAGVPTGFLATRYHSLIVEKLSDELACIAECDDGLVMAARHREWPAWGVQFHPESIGSEYGRQILENFIRLTGPQTEITEIPKSADGRHRQPRPTTGVGSGDRVVHRRELDQVPDAAAAFKTLFGSTDVAFWIDTLATDGSEAPRTYIGAGLGPGSEVLRQRVSDGSVNVRGPDGSSTDIEASVFDVLGQRAVGLVPTRDAPPLHLGYVGWLGYELRDLGGPRHSRRSPEDDAFLVLADRMLVIDHGSSRAWVAALRHDATDTGAAEWVQAAVEALRDLDPLLAVSPRADVALPPARLRHDVRTYRGLIEECQELIRAGECYELCLTNQLSVEASVEPFELFRVLRELNPAPFAAFFRTPEVAVVGSSPERFLTLDAGSLVSKPMKGTRSRGADPAEDERLRADLAGSVKDRAENLMIADLVRNDLGAVCRTGSVRVDPLFGVETYPHVHQLVSTVHGSIEPGRSVGDVLRATFPAGSMTGAPKRRSTEILDRLEGDYRGIYSGALGFVTLDGLVDLSMVIRTAVVTPDEVRIGVGGAITVLSDPEDEVAEMLLKGDALLRAVAVAAERQSLPR